MPQQSSALVAPKWQALIGKVEAEASTEATRRAYRTSLLQFMGWYLSSAGGVLDRDAMIAYRADLCSRGLAATTVNQRMLAVRKLAKALMFSGDISALQKDGVFDVKGAKVRGVRIGNWLTRDQAVHLLNTPPLTTLRGLRDRAILAMFLGCGLRREDVAGLYWAHLQQREGRWVIADMVGKGNRVRTVPVPAPVKARIDAWAQAAHLGITCSEFPVFNPINRGGNVDKTRPLSTEAVYQIVINSANAAGLPAIRPHDLRRTFARQTANKKAALDQIKETLGHESITTTERYIGRQQDLVNAPGDLLDIWGEEE